MLTKAQALMVQDGFPADLFRSPDQRKAYWAAHPDLGCIPTASFKDAVDPARDALREQFEREATAARIAKLKAGIARKAVTAPDRRGQRWDPRRNSWVPIDPPARSLTMTDDTKATDTLPGDQATSAGDATTVANNEDTMVAKSKKSTAKKPAKKAAKKAAKKPVAKKAAKSGAKKSAPKAAGPKGEGVIATIIKTISRASGASASELVEILTAKFPDREPDSMRKTVMIQANKNAKRKEDSEKRGRVYYGSK